MQVECAGTFTTNSSSLLRGTWILVTGKSLTNKRAAKAAFAWPLAVFLCLSALAQESAKESRVRPEDLPTSSLLSQAGPTFRLPGKGKHTTLIVYGDQRF